ncbi:MAG: DUF4364 family protein [Lachnospiraceae bacterium]
MIQDKLTLYKLIILYMLNQIDFPLTTSQISEFILEKGYTNYLSLQQSQNELIQANLVKTKTIRNRTLLYSTDEGNETLHFFGNRISDAIKADIAEFFKEKEIILRTEVSVSADYYKSTTGEYEVRMVARDRDTLLMDLTLSVPDSALALSICDNWEKRNQEIYQYLMEHLL